MADDIIKKLLQIPIPENESVERLEIILNQINKYEVDKKTPIGEVLSYLQRFGIPKDTQIKYLGILVQSWIDEKKSTEIKSGESLSSTTGGDLSEKVKNLERDEELRKGIRERSSRDIKTGVDKQKSIYEEQIKRIEEDLARQKEAESALRGKKIGIKILKREEIKLDNNEQGLLRKLENTTSSREAAKRTIDVLSKEVENFVSSDSGLKVGSERSEILSRAAVVGLVYQIHHPDHLHQTKAAILSNLAGDTDFLKSIVGEDILEITKKGSIALALQERSPILASLRLSEQLFGKNVTRYLYGDSNIVIQLTEAKRPDSDFIIDLGALSEDYGRLLETQKNVLKTISTLDSPTTFVNSSIANFSQKKEEKLGTQAKEKANEVDPIEQIIKKFRLKAAPKYVYEFEQVVNIWEKTSVADKTTSSLLSESTGPDVTSGITVLVASTAGKATSNLLLKTTIKESVTAFFASIGLTGGPIVAFISGLIAWVGSELFSKFIQWWNKNKEITYPLLAGVLGFGMLPFFGPVVALSVAGLTFVGLAGVGTATTIAGAGLSLLGYLWRSMVVSLAGPLIFLFVVVPTLTAFVLLIINNSAYVVPPGISSRSTGADNPFMLVTKIASPTKLENPTTPQQVIYAVSIQALKESLFNVKITSVECTVIKKDGSKLICPDEDVPPLEEGKSISPTQNHAFSFISRYDSRFSDSLVLDTVEVTAETADGTVITTSGSASVCIGECPKNCAEVKDFADTWPSDLRKNVEEAIAIVSGYQGFTAKLCPQNKPVYLCYKPSAIDEDYYAWHVGNKNGDNCDIYFNSKGIGSDKDASFMITHELTHHIQAINGSEQTRYESSGGYSEVKSSGFCTYKDTAGSASESMAEAAALFVNSSPSWDSCASNYKSKYPKNYIWAETFMTK